MAYTITVNCLQTHQVLTLAPKMLQQARVNSIFKGLDKLFPALLQDLTFVLENQNRNRLEGLQARCSSRVGDFLSLSFVLCLSQVLFPWLRNKSKFSLYR